MKRYIASTLVAFLAVSMPLVAQQEPTQDVFEHSSRDLAFQIPVGFELVSQNRRYLRPEAREVPRFQRMWQRGPDGIIISIIVVPDAAWQTKIPKQIFTDGLAGMLSDPTLKIVSQRSYEFQGAPATSVTCFYNTPGGTSQRFDCFLVKPNMFMVGYMSSKPSSWDDPPSKEFFQTLALKPK